MKWADSLLAPGDRRFDRHVVLWLSLGYPLLYAVGYLSKSADGSAAIWPRTRSPSRRFTAACPAALARSMGLFRRQARFALVISPLWIVALPGAFLGAVTRADAAGIARAH